MGYVHSPLVEVLDDSPGCDTSDPKDNLGRDKDLASWASKPDYIISVTKVYTDLAVNYI